MSEKCVSSAGDDFECENWKQEVVWVKMDHKKDCRDPVPYSYKTEFFILN